MSADLGIGKYQLRWRVQTAACGWVMAPMVGTSGAVVLPLGAVRWRVRVVDAMTVCEPGSTGGEWRVHYAVNLADLQCDFFQLAELRRSGETFRRVPVSKGDIMLGDRVYATPPSVVHVLDGGGDVIVRLNRASLPLFDLRHRRMDLAARMRTLKSYAPGEFST